MRHSVGFDVGKGAHWACVLDGEGEVLLSRRVEATEEALEEFCAEIAELGVTDERVVGIDLVGGPAALLEAVLLRRGEKVRYLPGTAVNKAREAYAGSNQEGPLFAVSRVARPAAARRLGEARLSRWLEARGVYGAKKLAGRVVAAAKDQRHELPAAETKATLVAEIASEVLRTKERIDALDARLAELVEAHPEGKLVMSLPGMGIIMTAEFLAVLAKFAERGASEFGIHRGQGTPEGER